MIDKNHRPDSIVQQLHELIDSRAEEGLKKYGTTMDRDDLSPREWLQHSIEEQLDNLLYSIKLLEELKKESNAH